MINLLGKSLVFLHTLLSLVAMTWAAGLFLQFSDWGWKEPKQELEGRIASEYDKSVAALKQAVRARDLVLPAVAPAEATLATAERDYPRDHLFYIQELEKLRGEPRPGRKPLVEAKDTVEVKEVKGPGYPLDAGKTGHLTLEGQVNGYDEKPLDKTLVAYRAEEAKIKEEIVKVEKEIQDVVAKSKEVTYTLTGRDDAGDRVTSGLYDLLDAEYDFLTKARQEREELKPVWAETLEEARRYTETRSMLEQTLDRLKKAHAAPPKGKK